MSRLHLYVRCLAIAVTLAAIHACAPQPHAAKVPARAAACAPGDGSAAAQAIRTMYAAATVDDAETMTRLFAPDFYAFDAGMRFTGPELIAWIKAAHIAGKTFVWNVVAPETHVACDLAWVTWENRGSIGDGSGTKAVTWIESAVLRWAEGAWRIVFFHSSRVPPLPPPAAATAPLAGTPSHRRLIGGRMKISPTSAPANSPGISLVRVPAGSDRSAREASFLARRRTEVRFDHETAMDLDRR